MKVYNQKNQVNFAITNANSFLIKKYKDKFNELQTNKEKFIFLTYLWKKEFGASFYNSIIEFDNQHQQMIFSMKFDIQ